jgi:hypothetical protein
MDWGIDFERFCFTFYVLLHILLIGLINVP